MKIAYLTNNINPREGWGRYASDLILGVKALGHEVVILKENDDGYDGITVLKRGLRMFISAIKIIPHVKDCDIIHALDIYPYGITAYIANLFLRKKLIITVQGAYSVAPFYNTKTRYLAQIACKNADLIIAISNHTKNELLKNVIVQDIQVINHGINLKKFYQERKPSDENYILSVGYIKPRKGFHISIPAFYLAKKEIPDLKYKIVGGQISKKYFEDIKAEKVELLSNISDTELKDLYSKARLFILTSVNENHHFEGFGLVFLEAAASGIPVIGTKNNGIEDSVKNGFNGILVDQNDIEGTAKAIVGILSNHEKWLVMSNNSYTWAKEHDLNRVVNKYLLAYNQVLK